MWIRHALLARFRTALRAALRPAVCTLLLAALGLAGHAAFAVQPAPPSDGDSAPSRAATYSHFVLPDLAGRHALALSDYRGRALLVVHFAAGHRESREALLDVCRRTADLVKAGKLCLLPVAHDHYADRVRLFAAAHDIDGPIAHDILNLTGARQLPRLVYVPARGKIRELSTGADFDELIKTRRRSKPAAAKPIAEEDREKLPEPRVARRTARDAPTPENYLALGDALVLAGHETQIDQAIDAYTMALTARPDSAAAQLRLGVAHRLRFDRPQRQPGDLAAAFEVWRRASRSQKNCDPLRLRLSPLDAQPHAGYDWIPAAVEKLSSHEPAAAHLDIHPLPVELGRAAPGGGRASDGGKTGTASDAEPAPEDRSAVRIEHVVEIRRVSKTDRVAILLALIPDAADGYGWSGEDGPSVAFEPPAAGELQPLAARFAAIVPIAAAEGASPSRASGEADPAGHEDLDGADDADDAPHENGKASFTNDYNEPPSARPRLMLFHLAMPAGKRAAGKTLRGTATYSLTRGGSSPQVLRQPIEITLK